MAMPKEAWGDTRGWVVAGVVAATILGLLAAISRVSLMTEPTALGRDPSRWSTLELPPPSDVAVADVTEPNTDGGRLYQEVMNAYLESLPARRPYEDFLRTASKPAPRASLPLLENLVDAARYGRATLFADSPGSVVNYDRTPEQLDGLYTLGRVANKQASLLANPNIGGSESEVRRARQLHRAAYALGRRMAEERLVHRELEYGVRLMSEALGGLAALAQVRGETDDAQLARSEREQLVTLQQAQIGPIWGAIGTINDLRVNNDAADVHVGDVAMIATSSDANPMWRAEALLRLGRYRFDATRAADRRGADRIIQEQAQRLDEPRLRLAAEAAANLTQAELQNAR